MIPSALFGILSLSENGSRWTGRGRPFAGRFSSNERVNVDALESRAKIIEERGLMQMSLDIVEVGKKAASVVAIPKFEGQT